MKSTPKGVVFVSLFVQIINAADARYVLQVSAMSIAFMLMHSLCSRPQHSSNMDTLDTQVLIAT